MEIDIYEVIGYAGSVIVALSMIFSSIVKFRVVNLIGAALFTLYGLFIDAIPVVVMNGFIVLVDIYYLALIYRNKQVFDILDVNPDDPYLTMFIQFNKAEISKLFPDFDQQNNSSTINYLVLRNMNVAGVFLGTYDDGESINVRLDFATPEYRDYKNGRFVINVLREKFKSKGYKTIYTYTQNSNHIKYLKRIGFRTSGSDRYEIKL